MKTVSITGHTKGIGHALLENMSSDYNLIGFSRSNGYDISTNQDSIIQIAKNSDIFVNNAYYKKCQIDLFIKMLYLWKYDSNKTIVNIISRVQYDTHIQSSYNNNKTQLAEIAHAINDRQCRIINVSPGFVATDGIPEQWLIQKNERYITSKECAHYIRWAIDQPVEIGNLSLWKR
jgi:short-subunit dehydrogenase